MIYSVRIFRPLACIAVLLALLAAPLILVPAVHAGSKVTIEAPTQAKKGMGLVLLVSLQRS